jgi:hypothetical protein
VVLHKMTKGPESSWYTARQQQCVSLAKLPAVNASGSTEERERFLIEHVPVVRFIARRIHEGLPQHILIEDLYSAGWDYLTLRVNLFHLGMFSSAAMRNFEFAGRSSIVCEILTGVRADCGAKGGI